MVVLGEAKNRKESYLNEVICLNKPTSFYYETERKRIDGSSIHYKQNNGNYSESLNFSFLFALYLYKYIVAVL